MLMIRVIIPAAVLEAVDTTTTTVASLHPQVHRASETSMQDPDSRPLCRREPPPPFPRRLCRPLHQQARPNVSSSRAATISTAIITKGLATTKPRHYRHHHHNHSICISTSGAVTIWFFARSNGGLHSIVVFWRNPALWFLPSHVSQSVTVGWVHGAASFWQLTMAAEDGCIIIALRFSSDCGGLSSFLDSHVGGVSCCPHLSCFHMLF